jgi:hypothetical protein
MDSERDRWIGEFTEAGVDRLRSGWPDRLQSFRPSTRRASVPCERERPLPPRRCWRLGHCSAGWRFQLSGRRRNRGPLRGRREKAECPRVCAPSLRPKTQGVPPPRRRFDLAEDGQDGHPRWGNVDESLVKSGMSPNCPCGLTASGGAVLGPEKELATLQRQHQRLHRELSRQHLQLGVPTLTADAEEHLPDCSRRRPLTLFASTCACRCSGPRRIPGDDTTTAHFLPGWCIKQRVGPLFCQRGGGARLAFLPARSIPPFARFCSLFCSRRSAQLLVRPAENAECCLFRDTSSPLTPGVGPGDRASSTRC